MRFPLVLVFSSCLAFAQEPAAAPAPDKVVSGAYGIDFTTHYFFRGILQENQGIIGQPWIELGYGVYDGDADALHDVSFTFGLWNSLHDNGPTGGTGGIWYENDFYAGFSGMLGERLSIGTTYTSYYSPNATFTPVEEIAFSFGLDDKGLMGESITSGLQPSVVVAIELDGQADGGAAGNLGVYAQLGIEPSFGIGQLGKLDITLALPVTIGLSLRDYYEVAGDDDFLGFLDIGVVASSALPMPAGMGPWSADLGLHFLSLGDNNETRNSGDAVEFVLSFGLSTSF